MKASKVLQELGITRRTLANYVKSGKIKTIPIGNGFYDYDEADVKNISESKANKNCVVIYLDGKKIKYDASKDGIKKILEFISTL